VARSSSGHAGRATRGAAGGDFGSRLQDAIRERGWTAGETAKRVREQLGEGARFTPANISHYTRGRSIPRVRYLDALSAVLGIDKRELMGQDNSPIQVNSQRKQAIDGEHQHEPLVGPSTAPPPFHLEDRGSEVWLQINQQVPWSVALKLLQALKSKDQ
jgi:transcriptional regulator with XRE-family HTH domain